MNREREGTVDYGFWPSRLSAERLAAGSVRLGFPSFGPDGRLYFIEQRSAEEVTHLRGRRIAPEGVSAAHPAFDVTPSRYVTAIITEQGVHTPPFEPALRAAVGAAETARRAPVEDTRVRA